MRRVFFFFIRNKRHLTFSVATTTTFAADPRFYIEMFTVDSNKLTTASMIAISPFGCSSLQADVLVLKHAEDLVLLIKVNAFDARSFSAITVKCHGLQQ